MELFWLIGILSFTIIGLTLGLILISNTLFAKRPTGKISSWGVHFTPNTVFSSNDLDKAITAFVDTWGTAYPQELKRIKRSLKKLDIIWHSNRIQYKNETVLALMERPNKIHLWIGPRLADGTRKLAYTGLFDQLGKFALLAQGVNPDTSKPEIRKILANARARIF